MLVLEQKSTKPPNESTSNDSFQHHLRCDSGNNRTVARKFLIGGLCIVRGLDILRIDKSTVCHVSIWGSMELC